MNRILLRLVFILLALFAAGVAGLYLYHPGSPPLLAEHSKKTISDILLFAHRGVTLNHPENSLGSIGEASRLGFRAMEMDVRRSAEGTFVLFHDKTAHRMLGIKAPLKSFSLAQLNEMPLLMGDSITEWKVPALSQVFALSDSSRFYYLDLKLYSFSDIDELAQLVKKHKLTHRAIIASADIFQVLYCRLRHPGIITALEGFDAGKEWSFSMLPLLLRPSYLSGFYHRTNQKHIQWLKSQQLMHRRIVYGVDNSNFNQVLSNGFQMIICDYDSFSSPAYLPPQSTLPHGIRQ